MQPAAAPTRPTFEQWRVLAMLVICVLINYLDRQNLSVSLTNVKSDLHLSVEELGWLSTGFFWTYAVCQIPAGWLLDRIDVYRLLGASFFLMSLATALTGFVESFAMLFILRLAVGVGAAAAFPSFSKILASDYQERHRG